MKYYMPSAIKAGIFLTGFAVSLAVSAHPGMDPSHPTKIVTSGTNQVIPTDIHVEQTSKGVQITGKLRKSRHSHSRIHGRVNIDLVGPNGDVLHHKSVQIRPTTMTRQRTNPWTRFTVTLPSSKLGDNSIKVSYGKYKKGNS